ncbi:hypothetical protein F442_20004 [Phytophthora nicotianae P10297]|uniref:Uncharacterized protein n=1 Tax=Phytophthora nicotianae P10297 TaxID=1317064 RepID=W2Y7X9_PHYNI|nr:hypothetical protein F442_20004 [Phytophthora nicotianae P10297]
MPAEYARYTFATKLQVEETTRNGGAWESVAENLGDKLATTQPYLIEFLLDNLRDDPALTFRQLADMLAHLTKELQYINSKANNLKRREYLIQLQKYQAAGKTILCVDARNVIWATRT